MGREIAYDTVFHAQSHFRSVLECMSRPGTISALEQVDCTPPPPLGRASVLVAMALLSADVGFCVIGMTEQESSYLTLNTRAREMPIEKAAFLFASGTVSGDVLEGANCGTLAYPDTSATLIAQVAGLASTVASGSSVGFSGPDVGSGFSPSDLESLKLTLHGPGIDGLTKVYVRGLNPDLLLALQARNVEFPLGIDTILTCDDRGELRVLGLPRTTRVSWDAL